MTVDSPWAPQRYFPAPAPLGGERHLAPPGDNAQGAGTAAEPPYSPIPKHSTFAGSRAQAAGRGGRRPAAAPGSALPLPSQRPRGVCESTAPRLMSASTPRQPPRTPPRHPGPWGAARHRCGAPSPPAGRPLALRSPQKVVGSPSVPHSPAPRPPLPWLLAT